MKEKTSCVSYLIWLMVVINIRGKLCIGNKLYGIIVVMEEEKTTMLQYTYIKSLPKFLKHFKISYTKLICEDPQIETCLNKMKKASRLTKVPNGNIFLKVFRMNDLEESSNEKVDQQIWKTFLQLTGVPIFGVYNQRTSDILTFGHVNLDLLEQKQKPSVLMIFNESTLYVSFEANNPTAYPTEDIFNVEYKSENLHVFAETFECYSPYEFNIRMYHHMLSNPNEYAPTSDGLIHHPCLPHQAEVFFDSSKFKSNCVENRIMYYETTFFGSPHEINCNNLIEAVMQTKYTSKFGKILVEPLFIGDQNKLIIYTTAFTPPIMYKDFETYFQTTRRKKCVYDNKQLNNVLLTKCFQISYLNYLFKRVLKFNGKNWMIKKGDPGISLNKMILVDPRLEFKILDSTGPPEESTLLMHISPSKTSLHLSPSTAIAPHEISQDKKPLSKIPPRKTQFTEISPTKVQFTEIPAVTQTSTKKSPIQTSTIKKAPIKTPTTDISSSHDTYIIYSSIEITPIKVTTTYDTFIDDTFTDDTSIDDTSIDKSSIAIDMMVTTPKPIEYSKGILAGCVLALMFVIGQTVGVLTYTIYRENKNKECEL